jgi:cytochrome c-type biogenesis protein CcmE
MVVIAMVMMVMKVIMLLVMVIMIMMMALKEQSINIYYEGINKINKQEKFYSLPVNGKNRRFAGNVESYCIV